MIITIFCHRCCCPWILTVVFVSSPISQYSHIDRTWPGSKISEFLNLVRFLFATDGRSEFSCVSYSQLFLFPSNITMAIAGTRIHRSLQHFAHPTTTCDIFPISYPPRSLLPQSYKCTRPG